MVKTIPVWKKAPFIRLLIPLTGGIAFQWEFHPDIRLIKFLFVLAIALLILSFSLSVFNRFRLIHITGIAITLLFFCLGCLLSWRKNIEHDALWFGNFYRPNSKMVLVLKEPLIEKANSFKALASVMKVSSENNGRPAKGDVIVYFKKDSLMKGLSYGSQIILRKPLHQIKNAENPGGFDYKRFCLFQNITHQVWLQPNEFILLAGKKTSSWNRLLFAIRNKVLSIIRHYVPGEKEKGLAEALLIGYKDDLDRDLVQSYSNTGVVHIIAISGMHLALIFLLLNSICKPLQKLPGGKWLSAIIVIAGLWIFSLLAGGQASVLRSAVMFSFITLGNILSRKNSIYNSLALSAFVLLCYDPFWLWDVGFQLSYAAVLSIVIFTRPVYNWFYIKNKILDHAWKLNSVTIAAQILTTPISIYHFHQFPNFFLLTNFIAVPLSGIIVLGEILLCSISFMPFVAGIVGKILSAMMSFMNFWIVRIENLPGSLWPALEINIFQLCLLTAAVTGFSYWLLEKRKQAAWIGLFCLMLFMAARSISFSNADKQQKLIIYNIPKHRALDVFVGRKYFFMADSALLADALTRNFHIKPSRILYRAMTPIFETAQLRNPFIQIGAKRILLIDRTINFKTPSSKIEVDLLVISGNPKLYLTCLLKTFTIRRVVFDSSTPAWKIKYWARDCDSFHIPCYNVSEQGAFVMTAD